MKRRVVAPYESFFLRPTPLLQLALIFYGVCDAVEPLGEHQRYWPASRGITAKGPGVMLSNSYF
jgi:hypothetical protein